jgi:hypothetical protein
VDRNLLSEANKIVSLAIWPGSIVDWMEKDIGQFPLEGTVLHQLTSHQWPPESARMTRANGKELLWASEAALEILRRDPELVTLFLRPLSTVLRDDYEQISRVVLFTLEPLVMSGRINVPHEPVSFAGFAYLFVRNAIDGVLPAVVAGIKGSDRDRSGK